MDDSRAGRPASAPKAVPPYLVVLALAAGAGIALIHRAAGLWHEAAAAASFPADVRGPVIFALLFNASLAAALAVAALGEIVVGGFRLARKAPVPPTLGRIALALGILAAFGLGHRLVNPWLGDLVRALRSMA